MSQLNYLEELRNLENVVINNGRHNYSVTSFEDLIIALVDDYDDIYIGEELLTQVDYGVDKEDYGSGPGHVTYTVGDKLIRIDYWFSSWDDPEFRDMYYVEKKEKVITYTETVYERID